MRDFLVKLKNSNPYLLYLWTANQKRKGIANLKEYTDKEAIVSLYKNYSGKVPNLENPKTFSEKMQWLKLHYHNPLMTVCADKYEVRDYLVQKGYGDLLNEVIGTYDTIGQLNISELPSQFVLKATHGSGWNLICTDKSKINWWIWKKIMNVWLHNNIFWPGREWPYKKMKPRLIAEPFLKDESGQLMDFKFFCFNGKAHFVQANKGRDTAEHAQNFYDLDWKILPFGKDLEPRPDITIPAPFQLKKMAAIAEDLAVDFPFVRVDFYEVNQQIIFGEMTFYPKSGLPDFTPIEYDHILGDLLQLPAPFIS
ncbi:MAG: ATP-grasp fold amidoligase family protein [Flavobacterium sp.]|nr:ATP-grasp fold amidoligase family protein [Flavobacterium sp.]